MFEELTDMFKRIQRLSEMEAWKIAFDEKTKQFIISMNTHEQLGEEGIDSNSDSLGEYAPFTVQFRRSKGLQVDHIDFKQTGDYWRSWKVDVGRFDFSISVNDARFDELVNELRFSPDHIGLTDENMERLKEFILEKYVKYIEEEIFLGN